MLLSDGCEYHVHHGDTILHMMEDMPPASVDAAITSVPFPTLYAYTSSPNDIGNSEDMAGDAKIHLSYFYRAVRRVLKPGRVLIVHAMQIPNLKRGGGQGLTNFRDLNIRLGQRAGLIYEYDWLVRKNPQAQAQLTKAWELKFQGLETDRAMSRGTLCDYLIKFRPPGENAVPIDSPGQVSRNDWIEWAEGCWYDIKFTETLNCAEGRGPDDTRHICPFPRGILRRLVPLYSNPGEIVFDPFIGIGTTGYEALKFGRRAYGCELKDEYHRACMRNLARAVREREESNQAMFPAFAVPAEVAP